MILPLLFTGLLIAHGLIHLMGVVKAYDPGRIGQLSQPVPKPVGWLWLFAAALFLFTAIVLITRQPWWWAPGASAVLLSQGLIIVHWQDAKWGTLANLLLLIVIVLGYGGWH